MLEPELGKLLTDYGYPGLAAIALLVPLCIEIYSKIKRYSCSRLTNHVIFSHLNELIECTIPVWIGDNSLKSQLIRKCVKSYAKEIKLWLHSIIALSDWDGEAVSKTLSEMFQKVEQSWREEQVPSIFIRKYKTYNLCNIQYIHKQIRRASDSAVYGSVRSKKLLILSITEFFFFSELKDLDHLVMSLNGELDKALANESN